MKYGSVCSGIEAATAAWHHMGWEPVFFSEIDKFPSAVLEHHYPDTPNLGDMTNFEEWNIERGAIDVLVGGTPCQSFSVAGLRGGLGDDRGNLSLTYMRMVDHLRPECVIWENVPGVLSSNGGRDFGAIIGALAKLGYGFAWRVLDAQNFGVPQRRRRVFLVGHSSGDARRAGEVLFESESGGGDIEASRAPREKSTGSLIPRVAGSLDTQCGGGKLTHQSAANGHLLVAARMRGFGDYAVDGTASTCKARDWKDATDLIAHRAGPLTAGMHKGPRGTEAIESNHVLAVADVAPTITSSGPPYSRTGNARVESEALVVLHDKATRYKGGGATRNSDGAGNGLGVKESETAYTVTTGDRHGVFHAGSVRRLTPVECERLQGFPDNFTDIPYRNKPNAPDSGRYKALGNSMAVPVMRWIGERINKQENK